MGIVGWYAGRQCSCYAGGWTGSHGICENGYTSDEARTQWQLHVQQGGWPHPLNYRGYCRNQAGQFTAHNGAHSSQSTDQIVVNRGGPFGSGTGQYSDFEIAFTGTWGRHLSINEIEKVEKYLYEKYDFTYFEPKWTTI